MSRSALLLIGFLLSFCVSIKSYGQTIEFPKETLSLRVVFAEVEKQTAVNLVFSEDDLNLNQQIQLPSNTMSLEALQQHLSIQYKLSFRRLNNTLVVKPADAKRKDELFYQPITGVVRNAITEETLPGATVIVEGFPKANAVTDPNGRFTLVAPVGRLRIQVAFLGYIHQWIEVLHTTGQEPFLRIALQPQVREFKEFVVKEQQDKAQTINPMVYSSGRSFSVEEANRYAGTLGDPARMVRAYAGVLPERDDRNDIIIRGNSPSYLQWRLNDIEIPNPNHYGGIGLTGNTVTLLNSNLLANSDFLTGAFPAEYGNALSGVFDLRLRTPNPKKHQFRIQTGWNGLEIGAEGPFSKKKDRGTFMATYRYSLLDLVEKLGIDPGILPRFQDLTLKVDVPVSDRLQLEVIGLLATSSIALDDRDLDEEELGLPYGQELETSSDLALAGLNARYRFTTKTSLKFGINVLDNTIQTDIDTFSLGSDAIAGTYDEQSSETKYSAYATLTTYWTAHNRTQAGFRWDTYDIRYQQAGISGIEPYRTLVDNQDQLSLLRTFLTDEITLSDQWRFRLGAHASYLLLNGSFAVEPRAALQYQYQGNQALSLSYGNHHQMLPRTIYFVETPGSDELTNRNLDFAGAHHYVLGHDWSLFENIRLKSEVYYQDLYNVPVEVDPTSTFSLANVGADFFIPLKDSLTNDGRGRNYGLEITLERFLANNYYFMLNSTVFQSEYKTLDNTWRSTAFNANYILNGMVGYEWWMTKTKAIGFDWRATYAGGKRYTPIDEVASLDRGEVVFQESRAFALRFPDYFRTDLKLYYRFNYRKFFVEFAMDLQNLTNQQNVYQRQFIPETNSYKTFYQSPFFPMFTFRCLF